MASAFAQRHYEIIADAIKEARTVVVSSSDTKEQKDNQLDGIALVCLIIKRSFEEDNPNFNAIKFLDRARVESGNIRRG